MPGTLHNTTNSMASDWKFKHLVRTSKGWEWKNKASTDKITVVQFRHIKHVNKQQIFFKFTGL